MRGRPTIRREQDYGRHCGGNWRRASEAQVNSQIQLRKKEEKPYDVIRTNRARERKKLRLGLQEMQQEVANYWSTHEGRGRHWPTKREYPEGFKGHMYPTRRTVEYPSARQPN